MNIICLEIIPIYQKDRSEEWDSFENAATYSYARSVLEQNQNRENFRRFDETSKRITTTIEYIFFHFSINHDEHHRLF